MKPLQLKVQTGQTGQQMGDSKSKIWKPRLLIHFMYFQLELKATELS